MPLLQTYSYLILERKRSRGIRRFSFSLHKSKQTCHYHCYHTSVYTYTIAMTYTSPVFISEPRHLLVAERSLTAVSNIAFIIIRCTAHSVHPVFFIQTIKGFITTSTRQASLTTKGSRVVAGLEAYFYDFEKFILHISHTTNLITHIQLMIVLWLWM